MARGRHQKPAMQFSKLIALLIIVFSAGIVFLMVCLNFILLWCGRESMSQETVAAITTYGGITATAGTVVYGALTGWRDHSRNTCGVTHGELGIHGPYDHVDTTDTAEDADVVV